MRLLARILDPPEGDDADVVGVPKEFLKPISGQWSFGPLARRPLRQTSPLEFVGQTLEAPFAGGVRLECPGDKRCPFLIDDYCLNRPDFSGDSFVCFSHAASG